MDEKKISGLELMANKIRVHSIKATTAAGSGHPTSCMSCAEIMSSLFFSVLDAEDEFILSKGHAAPILWACYAESGFIPVSELDNLRKFTSVLEGHPTPNMPFVKVATGSLGQGLPAGVGMALAKKLGKAEGRVYVLLGDGECAEGSIWEAANSAAYYNLGNLCAIVDVNRLGQSEPTMHGHDLDAYVRKFQAFGWDAEAVDGHNIRELQRVFDKARKSVKPFAVIAKTFKGQGVSFLRDNGDWHGKPLDGELMREALAEIGPVDVNLKSRLRHKEVSYNLVDFKRNKYSLGDMVSTRAAFGKALVNLGTVNDTVVAIDGDVKNSTMLEEFFKKFPERGFQSFIAEQNMVGMAIGFSALGYIPFVSVFSAFLTRAHDFIRMAHYSRSNLKIVGSHAGVSIGADGPSQMGLEDIPMFLNIPNSLILYPSDAVSAEYLVKEMVDFEGLSYLRTTREKTPVIYGNDEEFPIGGVKIVRASENDSAMVVTAGITLHEALKAHEILKSEGINLRVIDLYSIQPFDATALIKSAGECRNNVVIVEDHYCNAMGSLLSNILPNVINLCVRDTPRSGTLETLLQHYGIDASSIAKMVRQLV